MSFYFGAANQGNAHSQIPQLSGTEVMALRYHGWFDDEGGGGGGGV